MIHIITNVFAFARPITVVNTFGTRLRHARLFRRLTQKELARACGLSQGAIGNYESDSRRSPKDIFRLAEALKIAPAWLAMGTGPMEPDSVQKPAEPDSARPAWPFSQIDPVRIWMLTAQQRAIIEKSLSAMISAMEDDLPD